MKMFVIIPLIFLSACSLILPRAHDPVMFGALVDVKISMDSLVCDADRTGWSDTTAKIHKLTVYADLRKDPQAQSLIQLQEAVGKARDSKNKIFCESILKINRTRLDVVADAWRGR
jgi:hypothetical protein